MPSSHLILCHPLLLLPPIPPSIRVFSNESTLRMRWPKYWSFSFSIGPSNEHPELITYSHYIYITYWLLNIFKQIRVFMLYIFSGFSSIFAIFFKLFPSLISLSFMSTLCSFRCHLCFVISSLFLYSRQNWNKWTWDKKKSSFPDSSHIANLGSDVVKASDTGFNKKITRAYQWIW